MLGLIASTPAAETPSAVEAFLDIAVQVQSNSGQS